MRTLTAAPYSRRPSRLLPTEGSLRTFRVLPSSVYTYMIHSARAKDGASITAMAAASSRETIRLVIDDPPFPSPEPPPRTAIKESVRERSGRGPPAVFPLPPGKIIPHIIPFRLRPGLFPPYFTFVSAIRFSSGKAPKKGAARRAGRDHPFTPPRERRRKCKFVFILFPFLALFAPA